MKVIPRIVISFVAISVAILRIKFPEIKIDTNTIILIVIAALPWLTGIIDTAELPGGWKVKFKTLKETAEKAERIGLISPSLTKEDEEKYSFQQVGLADPNLALAGLRIEMEKRLISIAKLHNIDSKMQSVGSLLNTLSRKDYISKEERAIIADLISLLNSAVHGARVNLDVARWALEFGPKILKSLDERIDHIVKLVL